MLAVHVRDRLAADCRGIPGPAAREEQNESVEEPPGALVCCHVCQGAAASRCQLQPPPRVMTARTHIGEPGPRALDLRELETRRLQLRRLSQRDECVHERVARVLVVRERQDGW